MPQLDLMTFFTQFFWFSIGFSFFYIFLLHYVMPVIALNLKFRRKRLDILANDINKKKESVSDIFSDQIINSDPDKMIDYREGFILLAYRDKLIYLDVSAHNFEVYPTPRTGDEL